jgi:hypothetical protein
MPTSDSRKRRNFNWSLEVDILKRFSEMTLGTDENAAVPAVMAVTQLVK